MATLAAAEWKRFYEAERARLGKAALRAMIDRAPAIELGRGSAAIFPHTRLEVTGLAVAAVARAVVESGAGVLAIGVLHGLAPGASASNARRVHHAGEATTAHEFSLDAFVALLAIAAEVAQKPIPHVHVRYPWLAGEDPASLAGIDELAALSERMAVVATADPIHHGIGYGDDAEHALDGSSTGAMDFARTSIDNQLRALEGHDFVAFQAECARVRSDFRNAGPTLAHVLGKGTRFEVRSLDLVDYTEALDAPGPTWVAGALVAATSSA
jgi:hypothetical protein